MGGNAGAAAGGASAVAGAGGALGGSAGLSSNGGSAGVMGTAGVDSAGGSGGEPTTWFGPPSCEGLLLCESFEDVASGQLPSGWQLVGYGERTVGASGEQFARGQQSLRIEIPAQAAVVAMIEIGTPEAQRQSHWGRHFVRFESLPLQFVHYDLFAGIGPWMTYENEVRWAVTGTGVGDGSGNQSFIYNVQPSGEGAPGEFGTEGDRSAHPTVGEWMCFEWFFDAGAQEARFFHMGDEVEYLHIDDERAEIPPFDVLRVGFQKFQETDPLVVYVDEVAFHDERIGCNR
jgi:hypothetical protein